MKWESNTERGGVTRDRKPGRGAEKTDTRDSHRKPKFTEGTHTHTDTQSPLRLTTCRASHNH